MNCIYHTEPPEKVRELPPTAGKSAHPGRWRDAGLLVFFFALLALLAWGCVHIYQHPEAHYPNRLVNQDHTLDDPAGNPSSFSDGLQPVSFPAENTGAAGKDVAGANDEIAVFGDEVLSNQIFLYYYWDSFYSLFDYYGSYLMSYLDFSKPFDQQQATETQNWNEYIAAMAADSWFQTQMLCRAAEQEGHTLSQEEQTALEESTNALKARTKEGGYADESAYLQHLFDPSSDLESYLDYQQQSNLAHSYAQSVYQRLYDENYDPAGKVVHNVNVRHILIQPEGEQTETAMATAKAKAEEIYRLWQEEPTEEHFSLLALEHNQDPGSQESGGLYEEVYPGQMVSTFNDWCFDESRQPGDAGIVETDYGYHIMYYVSQTDTVYSDENAQIAGVAYDAWLDDLFAGGTYDAHLERVIFTQRPQEDNP